MKILTVVGARPNFMKAGPIIAAVNRHNARVDGSSSAPAAERIAHVLVHTGQHYDERMSGAFFSDLDLPLPDVHLGVGSGSHAVQTGEIMHKFEPVLLQERPDVLVVVGDVNSTVACALVASKIAFDQAGSRPLVVHVEAGLRSCDRTMPEEINRIVTDHLSDLLFVTEESGVRNLLREGVSADKIHLVGNTMIDSLLAFQDKADRSAILDKLGLRTTVERSEVPIAPYGLLTLHRPANVDDRDALLNILAGLDELIAEYPVIFPVHPRTQRRMQEFGVDIDGGSADGGLVPIDPLGYLDFVCLMKHARLVVTDSGGIQEETTCLGIPCVTVRNNTERPATVDCGTNVIAGTRQEGIREAVRRQLRGQPTVRRPEKWDGQTAGRIVDVLVREHLSRSRADVEASSHSPV
jgi:UDP-N-acetylglucosamine 2-epimerase (non-hydrolysing)